MECVVGSCWLRRRIRVVVIIICVDNILARFFENVLANLQKAVTLEILGVWR